MSPCGDELDRKCEWEGTDLSGGIVMICLAPVAIEKLELELEALDRWSSVNVTKINIIMKLSNYLQIYRIQWWRFN